MGGSDSLVEAFQCAGARRSEIDEHPAAVVLIADARDVATLLELAEQGVDFASIDQEAPSEGGLACRSTVGEGAEHEEVRAAKTIGGERVSNQAGRCRGQLACEPARQSRDPFGRVVFGQVRVGPGHALEYTLGRSTLRESTNLATVDG